VTLLGLVGCLFIGILVGCMLPQWNVKPYVTFPLMSIAFLTSLTLLGFPAIGLLASGGGMIILLAVEVIYALVLTSAHMFHRFHKKNVVQNNRKSHRAL